MPLLSNFMASLRLVDRGSPLIAANMSGLSQIILYMVATEQRKSRLMTLA